MVRLRISAVRDVCQKHPGMMNDFLKASKVEGEYLLLPRHAFEKINTKYFGTGAGTVLHNILKPIVALPDVLFGTRLGSCGGCAERELKMNSALSTK